MEIILKATNLKKRYGKQNQTVALDGASFEIGRGEFTVLLGVSGSGKSTLLNLIGGMDRATEGTLCYQGTDLLHAKANALTEYRKNEIGFVAQSFNLINEVTVLENLQLQALLLKDQRFDLLEILKAVGLEGKEHKYPTELSGGEAQRVAIARALIKKSGIMLLDEPTGALDYVTGKQILNLLEELSEKYGTTIIMATHTQQIAGMADHVIVMKSGKIIQEMYHKEKVRAAMIEW